MLIAANLDSQVCLYNVRPEFRLILIYRQPNC